MAPPTSFITITSFPYSRVVTQAEFNVANEFWFKYTATVPIVIGFQTNSGGTFNPATRLFQADGITTLAALNGTGGFSWPLFTIADYYIRVTRSAGGASNFDFTFTADTEPLNVISIATGDLLINDDAAMPGGASFPAIVVSSTGEVKFFTSTIPSGEIGAILPSNVSIWHDSYNSLHPTNSIAVFDANFAYVTSVACGLTGGTMPGFGTDITNNKFYVRGGNRQLWTVSSAGVAANTGYTFPISPAPYPEIIAVNEDGTKLYWANVGNNLNGIHVLNLSTLTALPDLYTIPGFASGDSIAKTPNYNPGDIFVMPNGNVVTWWWDSDVSIYKLIILSSTGTLLYSWEYSYPTMSLNHLAYINGDSDHIMAWWYINSGLSVGRYGRITLATGVVDQDFLLDMFSQGTNSDATDKFGPSNSCTFVRLIGVTVTDKSGIYFINPTKTTGGGTGRHDSYYDHSTTPVGSIELKIPNPTIRSALFGE